jgi:YD repeat-containing protein
VITYTYDALNRLAGADCSDETFFAYQYDAVGNRKAMATTAGVVTHTYNAAPHRSGTFPAKLVV